MTTKRKQLRTYFSDEEVVRIQRYADDHGLSYPKAIRALVQKGLGEDAASTATPVLESMLDAILYKYFQGMPQILDQLVVAGFEQRQIGGALAMKMLESSGGLKPDAAGARWKQSFGTLAGTARQQADEFFRSLMEEGYIEGPAEVEGEGKAKSE